MATQATRPRVDPTNILRGVDWDSYVRMRNHPGNNHLRMSYLDGTLILVSPQFIHNRSGWRITSMIAEVCEALGIPSQCTVSSTLQPQGAGSTQRERQGARFRLLLPRKRAPDAEQGRHRPRG